MEKIKIACQEYLNYVKSENYCEDGTSNYENAIFEAAMEHFHGVDVWDVIKAIMA